jgi:glutamate dehydrogenase (NAD(P)+)
MTSVQRNHGDLLDLVDEWGPEKIVCVSHHRTGMRGVLVIDNTARGMGKGGTRMAPTVTVGEVARLARNMTWKWASVDMFYGGAKAGIAADPGRPDKEALLRAFARALHNEVPVEYVFGLDMGLTENDAAIIVDELGRGAAVGTPHVLGGLPYDALGVTGYGVAESAHAAAEHAGVDLASGARVSIQGFGAVGMAAARRLAELGATVVAVSTARGVLYDPDGLDVGALCQTRQAHGDDLVLHQPGSRLEPGQELTVDAEILIPAALQDVIGEEVARNVKAKLVVEGANLPTDAQAQQVLAERGIAVVPDFIANAGGVIAAGFAMDARLSAFRPEPDPVLAMVASRIRANTEACLGQARAQGITPHQAARDLAITRVRDAMAARGQVRA